MSLAELAAILKDPAHWYYICHAFSGGVLYLTDTHVLAAEIATQMRHVLKESGSPLRTSYFVPNAGRDMKLRISHVPFSTAIPLTLAADSVTIKPFTNGAKVVPLNDPGGPMRLVHAFAYEVLGYVNRLAQRQALLKI